ncbi:hypothetical protein [Amycolatopsis sp. H20-H5]|uniref:hypothetical protein n=1 Tax=Amycolatopsis sp. H20-H5 TaxID=3046309 RepID=UPI002DBBB03D|nr:hypothetical protein [Amycolatopsis sp. H20-H5]MEC3975715.1 hypothetical protein [Amycolatopsis sp. H20-H5]
MNDGSPLVPVYRSFVLVDVESSSELLNPDLMKAREALYDVLGTAFARAGIGAEARTQEDRGDGVMVLLDPAVPKLGLATTFLDELVAALAAHNQANALSAWLRLRIALHAGDVDRDEHGWGGDALTSTFRLLDAPELKQRFKAVPRAQCAVIASDRFYDEVIRQHPSWTAAAGYGQVDVARLRPRGAAWVRIPGYDRAPDAPEAPGPSPEKTTPSAATNHFSGPVTTHRDFVINN